MFAARRTQRSTRPLASSVIGIAIIAITGMQLMSTLDGTIVVVALPRMQAELGLSDAAKSWVITAYVLTFGGLLLLGGRVGDAIGHKRAFIAGVGVFTAASLVCGVAFDPAMLIVARAVQGIGAAVAAPTGLALIASTYAVVAPDQAQKRRDYEEEIVRTIYLKNTILPQDLTEIINGLRQLLERCECTRKNEHRQQKED